MQRRTMAAAAPVAGGAVKLSEAMQQCAQILKQIMAKSEAQPFNEPVDWQYYGLMDYPEIIKRPMDLGTIAKRLDEGKYSSPEKYAADVRLVWRNAMTYNRSDSEIYVTAEALSKLFDKKFQKIKPKAGAAVGSKRKAGGDGKDNGGVTRQDKVKFTAAVNQLTSEQLGQVVSIIHHHCPDALNEESDEVLEIEINNLDAATLATLNTFAANCIAETNKKKKPKTGDK